MWLIFILFIALVVMGIFTFILNSFGSKPITEDMTDTEVKQREKETRLKRSMFLVIVIVLGILSVTGGINGLIGTTQ